ncbi:malectin isoform X2 [Planococcus citri]|uniref:malectin isoform X2 n=1 Tax=Planococcus citri TaxID=170843 RepID=UPI0031F77074
MYPIRCFLLIIVCSSLSVNGFDPNRVIYAVNAGGDVHYDSLGIRYDKDPLHGKVGISSDYGKSLAIRRVPEKDFELYQVERYHHNSFGYEVPISEDGDYVLVLKFCEVYFNTRNSKVFDVSLNGMRVIENLDIYDKVGKGVAHDEYIQFSIKDNAFVYNNMESFINNGRIKVEFLKGRKDNPKVNAVIVYKGTIDDIPKLRPLMEEEKPYHLRERPERKTFHQPRITREDPYNYQDLLTTFWPILVSILPVIPIIYCLCKI